MPLLCSESVQNASSFFLLFCTFGEGKGGFFCADDWDAVFQGKMLDFHLVRMHVFGLMSIACRVLSSAGLFDFFSCLICIRDPAGGISLALTPISVERGRVVLE